MGVNFLNTISNILEDFFHCLKLPIKAIDSNYNLIYKIGVSDELDGFISSSLFIEKIKSNNFYSGNIFIKNIFSICTQI